MKNKKNEQIRKSFFFIFWIMVVCMMISTSPLIADEKPVQENKTIIGTELDYPPYSLLDEKGNPAGFNVELTQAIAEVMKLDIEIKIELWGKIRNALETGEIDAISGMYYSEERDDLVDFSSSYLTVNHAIFMRSDSPVIDSVNDLRNKEIIVMRGDIMHDFTLENDISTNLILVNTQDEALRLLASGRHDYALLAKLPGMYYINKLNLNNLTSTGSLFYPSEYCFAVKEGNISLLSQLSEGLAIVKETGRYNEIYNKWLGVLEPKGIAREVILNYAVTIFISLILFAGIVIFWIWTLRRQVAIKTKDLNQEITERKRAQETLQESEKQLQTLIDAMPDFVCFKDGNGHWLKLNDAGIRIFQIEGLDYIGKKDSELAEFSSKLRDAFLTCKESDARAWKEGGLIHGEETVPDSDGSARIYDVTKVAVSNQDGERKGLVTIGHDITDRKQAEKELKKYREHLEELIKERTKELEEKNEKLEEFNELFVGREFRIKELKDKVKELEKKH